MVYAYDQWAQMPVKDLYDTQIMLAAINAAKDMYEKGEQALKDFRKDYGDFSSPLSSDMDWYGQNFNISAKLDEIYARGGDPVRNSTDRGELYRWINSRPYAQYNQKVQAANNVAEYKKNRDALIKAGMYNPDYEREMLGGQLLEEWDGSLGNWTATTASPYLDYEKKYGHLFDKMGFEYDEEESKKHPGMQVMTKNKARMRDILSSSIIDLRNDPQYKYDLDRTYNRVLADNPDMSASEAMNKAQKMLENEIVERNYKGGMQMVEDPIEKERRAYNRQVALENLRFQNNKKLRAGSPGYDENGNRITKDPSKNPLGMKSGIMNTGITVLAGTASAALQGRQIKPNMRNIFNSGYAAAGLDTVKDKRGSFGLPIYNTTERSGKKVVAKFGPSSQTWDVFRNYITSQLSHPIEPSDFPEYMGATPLKDKEQFGVIQLTRDHIADLYNVDDIITHSYGYSGGVVGSKNIRTDISQNIENGVNYEVIPSNVAMTTMDRNTGVIDTYYKVHLKPTAGTDDKNTYDDYTLWIKDASMSTPNNNVSGRNPVTNLDVDERNMDISRSRAIKLDQKYKASMNNTVEFPVTGTWTGYGGDIYYPETISDDYFYPTLNE